MNSRSYKVILNALAFYYQNLPDKTEEEEKEIKEVAKEVENLMFNKIIKEGI